ncbi:AAA family ATPase [Rhizobium sp. LjRoot98]|uniref:ATP-binding protein n=1 Tax=unclassified Rhizobium TaxID=2613769 RepID=UPI000715C140|nr:MULTISPECIES: AAA family ATPase [unclassified Rhizobium]KQV40645.1 sugar translocase [Rhizobium sp. Root1204]KQX98693.1 sugar translocase [Rhizobium sp. Root1334]KRC10600.1 sugar translocase [Rhizobium sp. Root73]
MRLNRLDLLRYGKFTGRSLNFGDARPGHADFHLVYGPNEAGKSTLFSAFLDLLFGIERLSGYGFLHPYATMRVGGVIETGGRVHSVSRVKRNQNSLLGPDDQPLPDNLFSAALGSIDRATYQMMFSLDDDSIEKGGESILKSEGELGALLFSASSGLPDSSAILSGLKAQADAFYKPQGRKHKLAELKAELEALKDEKAAIDINAREFAALRKVRDAAAERHDASAKARAELRVSLDHARDRIEALPILARLRGQRSELAAFADLPEPPAAWHALLPQLQREETTIDARLVQLDADIDRRAAEVIAIERDEAVLALAGDIRDLENSGLEARHRTAASDMPNRLDERAKIAADIAVRVGRLERADMPDAAALILPAAIAGRLQDLAQKHAALNERLDAALREKTLSEAENAEALKVQAALVSGGSSQGGEPAALTDMLRTLRQNDCLLRQQTANRQIAALEDLLADKLATLSPASFDADSLTVISVPEETDLAEWTERRATLTEQLKRLDDRIAEEAALTAGDEAKLHELTRTGGFTADDAALTLRQERDRAWQAHAAQLDADSARVFENVLKKDDEAAALRLAHSQDLAQARGLSLSVAERNGKLLAFRQQHEAAHAAIAALRSEISAAAVECGLPENTKLNQLVAWLGRRVAALEVRNQLRTAQQDARLAVADEAKAMQRLTEVLEHGGVVKGMPARLEDAIAFAEHIIHDLQSAHRAHVTAAETVERAGAALRLRTAAWSAASEDMAEWSTRWQEAIGATWLAEATTPLSPQEITPVLTILQDLDKLIQRKADLDHRIDGMRKDQLAFATIVRTLAEKLAIAVSDEPLLVVQTIRDRLAGAERQETLFRRLSDENDARIAERRALGESRERHDAQKRGMLDLFDSSSLLEVGAHLETVKARQRLRERIAEAEADLAARLGVGRADEAEMLLSAVDADGLRLEMAALQARFEQAERDGAELHAERRDAERALAAIGGGDAAAHIEEKRRTVLAEIEERATAYLRLRMGILAGETALRLYRERHRSAMMRRASTAFSVISGGDYVGLTTQAEKGEEFLIANAAGGGSKLARDLSKGTRFQLYLALRMAGYHEIATTRESLPFIADDIMETFDDGRAGHAFSLMAEMAGVGQVIYLTHHQHLCDIARTACPDVTIHTL